MSKMSTCANCSSAPSWMCPNVYTGLAEGQSVQITVCKVEDVACETYCAVCRDRLHSFALDTDHVVAAAFDALQMHRMCLDFFNNLIRPASGFDDNTMRLN